MTSVYQQARDAFNTWLENGQKMPNVKTVVPTVEKKESIQMEQPKKEKVDVKKVHKKLVKKEVLRNPTSPKRVISKQQLENTKVFWESLPTAEYPIVRGLARVLSLDADSLPTHRAENLKSIIEIAVRNIGSGDESKIYQWVMQKMREGKISGERPEAQLRMYLAMK